MNNLYEYIYDPFTGKKFLINSRDGKRLLANFINTFQYGGAEGKGCGDQECGCGGNWDNCMENPNLPCYRLADLNNLLEVLVHNNDPDDKDLIAKVKTEINYLITLEQNKRNKDNQ